MGRDLFVLLTGPLQLEVTWYKIQNVEQQNNLLIQIFARSIPSWGLYVMFLLN